MQHYFRHAMQITALTFGSFFALPSVGAPAASSAIPVTNAVAVPPAPEGSLVKGSAPDIYLIRKGTRQKIRDMGVFYGLGFQLPSVRSLSDESIKAIPLGPELQTDRCTLPPCGFLKKDTCQATCLVDSNLPTASCECVPVDSWREDARCGCVPRPTAQHSQSPEPLGPYQCVGNACNVVVFDFVGGCYFARNRSSRFVKVSMGQYGMSLQPGDNKKLLDGAVCPNAYIGGTTANYEN